MGVHRRTAFRMIGSVVAMAALGGCSTTIGGLPTTGRAPTGTGPTGRTQPGEPPDLSGGVTGSITWNTGSMPPPYNYSWTAEFLQTAGTFTLRTNYATDQQSWSETFTVTADSMATLTAALVAAGVGAEGPPADEHLVGGSTGSYRLTTADGIPLHASLGDSSATATELGRISDAVEEFVGAAAWNTTLDSYRRWASGYR
jgi:hypothetical protein